MAQETEPYEPYGPRGEWISATEAQCERMSESELLAYEDLHQAFSAAFVADQELAEIERELKAVEREAAELEAKVAALPKMTHTQLVKDWIRDQRG